MTKAEFVLFAITVGDTEQTFMSTTTVYTQHECHQIWDEIQRVRALFIECAKKPTFGDYL